MTDTVTDAAADLCAERPLRADARRNRQRVVAAAREVFAEHGREAQMDDVARSAGVGVGTLYRHFPTKEALLAALAADKFERMLVSAHEALEAEDAWEAFTGMLWGSAEQMVRDRALYEAVSADPGDAPGVMEVRRELQAAGGELMRRAQAAGRMREDLTAEDLPVIMCSLGAAMQRSDGNPERWRRYVTLLIDGLRPPAG